MKLTISTSIIAFALIISGCDNRQKLSSDSISFSVGGIQLGAPKDSLKKPNELIGCTSETTEKAKCYVSDTNIKYTFLGAEAHFITVKLYAPYKNIEEINISIKGKIITKNEVEQKWNLKGKCLDRYEIDESQKFDTDSSGYFFRTLSEFSLLPSKENDFICLADSNSFLKYTQYTDTGKSEGHIDIYYLKDVFATNYRYLFKSKSALEKSNDEIAKAFSKPIINTPNNRCGKKYDSDSQTHGDSLEKLAVAANYKNGADKYFSAFISEICAGTLEDAKQYVSGAQIPIKSAQFIAQYFDIKVEFEEPSAQSKEIEETRVKLVNLGICQACAGNAAMYAVLKPNSECGNLVNNALSGDGNAVRKIEEFPAICEWNF